jgi:hypothetical protein
MLETTHLMAYRNGHYGRREFSSPPRIEYSDLPEVALSNLPEATVYDLPEVKADDLPELKTDYLSEAKIHDLPEVSPGTSPEALTAQDEKDSLQNESQIRQAYSNDVNLKVPWWKRPKMVTALSVAFILLIGVITGTIAGVLVKSAQNSYVFRTSYAI